VALPTGFTPPAPIPCLLPDRATAPGLQAEVVTGPRPVAAGIATTGPLARSLFFFGLSDLLDVTFFLVFLDPFFFLAMDDQNPRRIPF